MRHSILRSRNAVLLAMASAIIACGDGKDPLSPSSVPLCTGPVTVTVSGGTTPTFTWAPSCAAHVLLVEQGATDRWFIESTTNDGFGPGVRYGTVPAGAREDAPAIELVSGRVYDVSIYSRDFGLLVANREFTP